MINNIKQKALLFIFLILGGGIVLGASITQANPPIPEDLKLKVPVLQVFDAKNFVHCDMQTTFATTTPISDCIPVPSVRYAYFDDTPAFVRADEDVERLRYNSYTVKLSSVTVDGVKTEVFNSDIYEQGFRVKLLNGEWRATKYATTTLEHFNAQNGRIGLLKGRLLGQIAYAQTDFFPDAHTETNTVDGKCTAAGGNWDTTHDATASDTCVDNSSVLNDCANTTTAFKIERMFAYFDTGTTIGATDSIDAAIASVFTDSADNSDNDGDNFISVVQVQGGNVVSDTGLSTADYDLVGDAVDNPTEGHDVGARISLTTIAAAGSVYHNWTLNATGRGWISRSGEQKPSGGTGGITYLGWREGHDILDNPITTGGNSMQCYFAENTTGGGGTDKDPKLSVTFSVVSAEEPDTLIMIISSL